MHWYALRVTYGREKKAYDFIRGKGTLAFYPTIDIVKMVGDKRKKVTVSRIPNVFFAYGTEEEIKSYVYDNVNLPYLRFYYRNFRINNKWEKEPLIVPENQMESLRIICESEHSDIIFSEKKIEKFEIGQKVRVTDGSFKGVVGIAARYKGQQRVGIIIEGLFTAVTAYIPNAFLEKI